MGSNAATYTAPNDTKDGDREEEEDDEDDGTRQLRAIVPRASDGAAEEGTAMIGCSEADGLAAWQKVSTTATSKDDASTASSCPGVTTIRWPRCCCCCSGCGE